MWPFKTYYYNAVITETLYYDTADKNIVFHSGAPITTSTEIYLVKPIFSYKDTTGAQTRELLKNALHNIDSKTFFGYDVIDNNSANSLSAIVLKNIKNRIYATLKSVIDPTYADKDLENGQKIPLNIVEYKELVDNAVFAFIKSIDKYPIFDLIVYLQSRSKHSYDIANNIHAALKTNTTLSKNLLWKKRIESSKLIELKKLHDIDDIVAFNTITEMFNIEAFATDFVKAIVNIYNSYKARKLEYNPVLEKAIELILHDNTIEVVREYIIKTFKPILATGNGISVASHIRSKHNDVLATEMLKEMLRTNTIGDELGKIIFKELKLQKKERIPLHGHFELYQIKSHYDFGSVADDFINALNRSYDNHARILIVDDNMNTGDTYKQINLLLNQANIILNPENTDSKKKVILHWEYFILMKDRGYPVLNKKLEKK